MGKPALPKLLPSLALGWTIEKMVSKGNSLYAGSCRCDIAQQDTAQGADTSFIVVSTHCRSLFHFISEVDIHGREMWKCGWFLLYWSNADG